LLVVVGVQALFFLLTFQMHQKPLSRERQEGRANFTPKTRNLTAQRAGYRCSLPNCARLTVGPGTQPNQSHCVGRAAHVYSASGGGPRGRGGLSPAELKSPANAIWLCADHADLVDKKRGTDYPAGILLSYKSLHESRIARELGGIYTPLGWITGMVVCSSPLFAEPTDIELGKLTLFVGENGCGKTALCEWLASVVQVRYLERWARIPKGRNRVNVKISYLDPAPHSASVSFLPEDRPRYELDGKSTVLPVAPLKFIFPSELRFPHGEEQPNDLELISTVLRLHQYEVLSLCEELSFSNSGNVTRAWFVEDDEGCSLYADVRGTKPGLSFRTLSSSECVRVLMELAMLAASRLAETSPTILILDAGTWSLDTHWLKHYGEILTSPSFGFQTIASIPRRNLNFDELQWAGWKVIRLDGEPPDVRINSDIRAEIH
jgi:hypothetical protein